MKTIKEMTLADLENMGVDISQLLKKKKKKKNKKSKQKDTDDRLKALDYRRKEYFPKQSYVGKSSGGSGGGGGFMFPVQPNQPVNKNSDINLSNKFFDTVEKIQTKYEGLVTDINKKNNDNLNALNFIHQQNSNRLATIYNNSSAFFTTPNEKEKKAPNVLTVEPTDLTRSVLFDETPEENYIEIGDNYGIVKKGMTSDEFTDEAGNTSIFEEMDAIDETQNDGEDGEEENEDDKEDEAQDKDVKEDEEIKAVDSPEGKAEPDSDYFPTPEVAILKKKGRGPGKKTINKNINIGEPKKTINKNINIGEPKTKRTYTKRTQIINPIVYAEDDVEKDDIIIN